MEGQTIVSDRSEYSIDEFIGRGWWGTVFKATDLEDGNIVAIKIFHPRRPELMDKRHIDALPSNATIDLTSQQVRFNMGNTNYVISQRPHETPDFTYDKTRGLVVRNAEEKRLGSRVSQIFAILYDNFGTWVPASRLEEVSGNGNLQRTRLAAISRLNKHIEPLGLVIDSSRAGGKDSFAEYKLRYTD